VERIAGELKALIPNLVAALTQGLPRMLNKAVTSRKAMVLVGSAYLLANDVLETGLVLWGAGVYIVSQALVDAADFTAQGKVQVQAVINEGQKAAEERYHEWNEKSADKLESVADLLAGIDIPDAAEITD